MSKKLLAILIFISFGVHGQNVNPREFNYHKVDSLILSTKADQFNSPEKLGQFINHTYSTDHEKARAIFRWITDNIEYSYDNKNASVDKVFKDKKAVCQGYSELYKKLCEICNIKCRIVTGVAKNDIDFLNSSVCVSNHAWNIVTLNNIEYLIEATWAAGAYDSKNRSFIKEFKNEFYLTDPETFILQHFPDDSNEQLLQKKISKDLFCNGPSFNDGAVKCDLKSFLPKTKIIKAKKMNKTDFTFKVGNNLKDVDIKIYRGNPENFERNSVDFEQNNNLVSFYWEFEEIGTFYIIIYIDEVEAIYYQVIVS